MGNKEQSSVKCDQRDPTLPGWFRFTGAAGDRMPTKCPETKRCGTHAPGWLNGNHPSVAEGIVSREVCYHWGNCCRWKNKINVKNCGAFYVYELQKPPACSLRYCGKCLIHSLLNPPEPNMLLSLNDRYPITQTSDNSLVMLS